jgi:predicted dehydrogenase/sugar phosphate isomerase/epimerase
LPDNQKKEEVMFISIFSDELGLDIQDALPIIRSWGLEYIDLRGRTFGKPTEMLSLEELHKLKEAISSFGMKVGCLQTSLAKVHLPEAERQREEVKKLENIVRAADILDCRIIRSFHFWQPSEEMSGQLAVRPDELQKVLDIFEPLAEIARREDIVLAFENCGVTTDEVFSFLDALNVPEWGLAWDVYNSWEEDREKRQKDEDNYLQGLARRSRLVHVKGRGAVEGYTESLIPYNKVLQICDNAGLQGPVSAETHNPSNGKVDNVEMSRMVIDVIKKAWPSAAPGGFTKNSKTSKKVTRLWQDNPVGFVVVGLGMGHNRAKEITETPGTKLIGVCDKIEERAKRTGEACNVPYTTDVREWLNNKDVEAVFVLTETGRHAEVALQALEAGKHVMVTKPMEASIKACDSMIKLAEKKNRLLAVDFGFRTGPGLNTLKTSVARGRLGKLLNGTCTFRTLRTMDYFRSCGGWRGTKRFDGGGVFSNQSIHHIDEIAFSLGIPSKVRCYIDTQNHDIEAEDFGSAVWLYDSGLVITFTATSSYPHPTWAVLKEIVGTEGIFFETSGGPFEETMTRWYIKGSWRKDNPEDYTESQWLNSMDNLAAAVRTGAPLLCSGRDGRKTQSILDAMYRSAYRSNNGWVEVKPEL